MAALSNFFTWSGSCPLAFISPLCCRGFWIDSEAVALRVFECWFFAFWTFVKFANWVVWFSIRLPLAISISCWVTTLFCNRAFTVFDGCGTSLTAVCCSKKRFSALWAAFWTDLRADLSWWFLSDDSWCPKFCQSMWIPPWWYLRCAVQPDKKITNAMKMNLL